MIDYKNDNVRGRGAVAAYHWKPAFRDLRTGASLSDIANLSPADRAAFAMPTAICVDAKYGIGFEIEKTRLARGHVREYPLFCGFEEDSSCGYEAVTNILPLVGASLWRNKVYSMFHEAERIIEDQWSPSNYRCGGHISVSAAGLSGADLAEKMRPMAGIILALYRKRLRKTYACNNITMVPAGNPAEENVFGGWIGHTYSFARVRGESVEFRLPSRVSSVVSLKRRYELMYVLVDSAVKGHTPAQAMRRAKPIVLAMYDGDAVKAARVMSLGVAFNKLIATGKVNEQVAPFVDPSGALREHYTRGAVAFVNRSMEANGGYFGGWLTW